GESRVGDLPIQYAGWAAWQRRWLEGGEMERQLAYWRSELDGAETLSFSSDRPAAPSRPTRAGASLTFQLPIEVREGLERLPPEEGATRMMALLAGHTARLGRWPGLQALSRGSPVASRRT